MTTNKDLLKPEHGTVQAQDVHEIEKESEADSAGNRNLFLSIFITVQIIRLILETMILQGVVFSLLASDFDDFEGFLLLLILFFALYRLYSAASCGMYKDDSGNQNRMVFRDEYL